MYMATPSPSLEFTLLNIWESNPLECFLELQRCCMCAVLLAAILVCDSMSLMS